MENPKASRKERDGDEYYDTRSASVDAPLREPAGGVSAKGRPTLPKPDSGGGDGG